MRILSIFTVLLAALLVSCCAAPDVTASPVSPEAPQLIVDSPPVEDAGSDAAVDAGPEDADIDSPCTCEEELTSDASVDQNS